MLELRPSCENCNTPLPPDSTAAMEKILNNVCPNCGGGFVPRPIRPARNWKGENYLGKDPASRNAKYRPVNLAAHTAFAADIKTISPEKR